MPRPHKRRTYRSTTPTQSARTVVQEDETSRAVEPETSDADAASDVSEASEPDDGPARTNGGRPGSRTGARRRDTASSGTREAETGRSDDDATRDHDTEPGVADTVEAELVGADDSEGGAGDAEAAPGRPAGRIRSYGPMESIARRPLLALAPVLVLVTLAAALGVLRAPVYTAEARLLVGSLARNFTPADGLVAANQELTGIYSRVVGSPEHLELTAQELGQDVPADAVDASPVPESPFIRVEATGDTQEQAVERADAAAAALATYGAELRGQAVARDDDLLAELTTKSEELTQARLTRDTREEAYNDLVDSASPSAAALESARVALVEAEGALASTELEFDALREQYNASDTSTRGGIELNEFSAAEPKGSDRRSTFVLYVAAAALIGGLIGAALATLSANHWRLLPTDGTAGRSDADDRAPRASAFIWSNARRAFVPAESDTKDTEVTEADTETVADADADPART